MRRARPPRFGPANLPFTPQYPLWSDGTSKRRWLYLPPGNFIDASRPDAWEFPRGTRVWKEFAYGRPVETRYIERRADGSWLFATYVWNDDGSDAVLAPAAGVKSLPVAGAPGGRYEIPARFDCLACHEGAAAPLLGVGALQLSPDRDPLAAHGAPAAISDVDLSGLVARGWLRQLPAGLLGSRAAHRRRFAIGTRGAGLPARQLRPLPQPQRRASAGAADARAKRRFRRSQQRARAALGGRCAESLPCARRCGRHGTRRARPPDASVLALRMRSRHALVQMPPLGSRQPDAQGLALIERWITHDLSSPKEPQP